MIDKYQYSDVTLTKYYYSGGSSPYTWTYLSEYDQKPDPRSTVPLQNGTFVEPTAWRSFHGKVFAIESAWEVPSEQARYKGGIIPDFWFPANTGMFHGCYNSWPHVPAGITYELRQQLLDHLASKALNQDFDVGQVLGEMPETIAHLGETLYRLAKAAHWARKGRWRECAAVLGVHRSKVAKNWLELNYAWMPLIASVVDGLETLDKGLKQPVTSVLSRREDHTYGKPQSPDQYVRVDGSFKRGINGSYTFKIRNYLLYSANQLGLLNPIGLAWELMPLSFVIDWMFHVGTFLESLSLPIALDFLHGWITTYVDNSWEATRVGPESTLGDEPSFLFRTQSTTREVLYSFPYPLPYFWPNLNMSKVISMMALLKEMRK